MKFLVFVICIGIACFIVDRFHLGIWWGMVAGFIAGNIARAISEAAHHG